MCVRINKGIAKWKYRGCSARQVRRGLGRGVNLVRRKGTIRNAGHGKARHDVNVMLRRGLQVTTDNLVWG
ncbi:hypothetical protein KQX54_012137 [Cotesia glomerata]|uniref:Uncharacterized protein n=1 Tax=Cotesia glomerata TaxID=32391 RepID=A0AAV7J533_COTGL|nr:hypothetical protein KQX54_012137 [Cotesia glomerata]